MARSIALLSVGLVLLVASGCGEAPAANVAAVNQGVAPKPAGPPSGMPGEPAVKPGTEVPAQLGGPQTKAITGGRTPAISQPSTPAATETPAVPTATPTQPNVTVDPSAPSNPANTAAPSTAAQPVTPTIDPNSGSKTYGPPASRRGGRPPNANQATPPETNPAPAPAPAADPSAPTTGPLAPKADPSAPDSVKAQVGVGAQGKDYGNADGGYISEPISTYFSTKELITFNIQLPNAMKMFKAFHDGKNPKTQDEFQKEIIQENGIKLPELPEGSKYVYDPQSGELMVQHPKKK